MTGPAPPSLAWQLFRVRSGEGRTVLAFGAVAALLQMGVAVGFAGSDALFLTQVGVERLPVIYVLTPLVMAGYVPIHAYLLGRLGVDRVMTLTLAVLGVGAGAIWWAIHVAPGAPAVYAAKLFSVLWFIGLYSLYWNWIDGFFDIQDAKRIYPMFSAGEAMGGVVGGSLAAVLVRARPVQDLFLVWAGLALLAIPACAMIRRRKARIDSDLEEDVGAGFLRKTRRTAAAMRASPFVLILGSVLLTGLFLIAVTEYQYLGILAEGAGEEELAALLGTLLAVVSVFNVAVNLFLFNRLVLSAGVRNVALLTAAAFLAAFTLLLLEGGTAAAVVGFFTYHGVLASIEAPNQNFLFNAVPAAERRQVRTILEGLAEPLATAAGGAFLLLAGTRLSPSSISTVGLGVAVGYLALVLVLRRRYGPSLAAELKRRWLDLSRPSEAILGGLPPPLVASLRPHISGSEPAVALSALRILWMNDSREAVGQTLQFLKERPEVELQQARDLLGNVLDEADPEVARPLVEWVLDHTQELGPGFVKELGARGLVLQAEVEHMLHSPVPEEAAAAVVVMWRSPDPQVRRAALDALLGLLGSDARTARVAGVEALGHLGGDPLALEAARWLGDPDPAVRLAAVTAVRNAALPGADELVGPLLETLTGPERLALVGLEALARVGDPAAVPLLLRRADRFTPNVRRMVVRTLNRLGLKGVPQSVAVLRDPAVCYEGRVLAARSLARLAPAQLEALVPEIARVELTRAEEFQCHAWALRETGGTGAAVLRRFFSDQQARVTDYVLEVLSAAGTIPDYPMLRRWLRGGSAKERADGLEALEQALGRRAFSRLRPLLQEGSAPSSGGAEVVLGEMLERAVAGRLGIGSAAAAFALWEQDPARARSHFGRVLPQEPPPILRDTILDLLAPTGELGPIQLLHRLGEARFFRDIPLGDLECLAGAARQRKFADGEPVIRPGSVPTDLLVILEGSALVVADGTEAGPGSLLGASAVATDDTVEGGVVSRGCVVVSIPATVVEAAAHGSGAVASALFALREEVTHGAAA